MSLGKVVNEEEAVCVDAEFFVHAFYLEWTILAHGYYERFDGHLGRSWTVNLHAVNNPVVSGDFLTENLHPDLTDIAKYRVED